LTVNIHKEKVARRDVGLLTTNKTIDKQPKIVAPAVSERNPRYQRTPIDYSLLDGLGHGVQSAADGLSTISRVGHPRSTLDYRVSSVSSSSSPQQYAVTRANLPATLSRLSSTASSMHERPFSSTSSSSTLAPRFPSPSSTPPATIGHMGIDQQHYGHFTPSIMAPHRPPFLAASHAGLDNAASMLPPPPRELMLDDDEPLPPPPMAAMAATNGDWRPRSFLERALVLYDYEASKEDELSLREQSVVYVLRKNEDGWYEGVCDGLTGLFPGNYVSSIGP